MWQITMNTSAADPRRSAVNPSIPGSTSSPQGTSSVDLLRYLLVGAQEMHQLHHKLALLQPQPQQQALLQQKWSLQPQAQTDQTVLAPPPPPAGGRCDGVVVIDLTLNSHEEKEKKEKEEEKEKNSQKPSPTGPSGTRRTRELPSSTPSSSSSPSPAASASKKVSSGRARETKKKRPARSEQEALRRTVQAELKKKPLSSSARLEVAQMEDSRTAEEKIQAWFARRLREQSTASRDNRNRNNDNRIIISATDSHGNSSPAPPDEDDDDAVKSSANKKQ